MIYNVTDGDDFILWNNFRKGISVVNYKYPMIENQFHNFWPENASKLKYAVLNRSAKKIVGFSTTDSGIQIISVLSYFTGERRPEISQIELNSSEEWIGVEVSDDGRYIIMASLVMMREAAGDYSRIFRIKAITCDKNKVTIVKEKLLNTKCKGNNPKFAKSSGVAGELYVLTDKGQVHITRFISTLIDFEVVNKGGPIEVYPYSDITEIGSGSDFAIAMSPQEYIKVVPFK